MSIQTLLNGEKTVEAVITHIITGYQHLIATPSVLQLIHNYPSLLHLSESISSFIPVVNEGMAVADLLIEYGPLLYNVGHTINIHPQEAGKSIHDRELNSDMPN